MKKNHRKRWTLRDILVFSASTLSTLAIVGGCVLYFFSGLFGIEPVKNANDTPDKTTLPKVSYLFCQPQMNVAYELIIDFHKTEAKARRLYLDTSYYEKGGLSELTKQAGKLGGEYNGTIVVTDTQLAAVIDYVGGVSCNVDKRISTLCGGVSLGYSNLAGIAAIRLFEKETENSTLCLTFAEELLNKWCLVLHNKRSFFKLLDLSDNDLSYADYLPISEYFNRFSQ